jgi:hypothetical protein
MKASGLSGFRLSGACLTIAIAACGLAGIRWTFGDFSFLLSRLLSGIERCQDVPQRWQHLIWGAYRIYGSVMSMALPFIGAGTIATVIFGRRRSKDRSCAATVQPGLFACDCAAIGAILATTLLALLWVSGIERTLGPEEFFLYWLYLLVPPFAGSAVIGSWTTLTLTRQWHRQRTWSDRIGLLFGGFWILASALPVWFYCECTIQGFPA